MRKLDPERKLRYLNEYMKVWIDIWPKKPISFNNWIDSQIDKKINSSKKEAYKKSLVRCCYCNREFDENIEKTTDHIVAVSKGGYDKKENRKKCCFKCNQWKDNKDLDEWLKEVKIIKKKEKFRPPYTAELLIIMIRNIQFILDEIKENENKISPYKVKGVNKKKY